MSAFRMTVFFIAIAAVALGCYDLANPYRFGMFGYDFRAFRNGDQVVTRIYPESPVGRAGLRPGDLLLWSRIGPGAAFNGTYRRANESFTLPVVQHGKSSQMHVVTATYKYVKPIEEGPLGFLVLLISVATGVLVALRGSVQRREVRILALFFAAYGLGMGFAWFSDVATTTVLAFLGSAFAVIATLVVYYLVLLFIANFPPIRSPLRAAIGRIALPLVALGFIIQTWQILAGSMFPQLTLFQVGGTIGPSWLWNLLATIVSLLLIAGVLDGLIRTDEEHRVQMRWVGGAIILSASASLISELALFTNPNPPPWAPWISLFQDVPLLAIAYAILRHRLVDVSIVFSRAAVFGFVSITLVALFVAGEWVAAQILERGLGDTAANGWLGKAVPLIVALAVGLSARSIHGGVERRLNAIFFGRRAKALDALRRLALEADVVTDTPSLLTLTFESVRENIEGRYAAIYIESAGLYERIRSSHETLPQNLEQNDSAIVRLRRWNEPFEMDFGSHPLSEALLLPMTVRGSLLGVLVCGPKRERTHYLSEEIDRLALVAHRVGTAYELLSREAPSAGSADIDLGVLRELIRAEMQALHTQPT